MATTQWQWLRLSAGPVSGAWQWLRLAVDTGATLPTRWQWLRLSTQAVTASTLSSDIAGPYDAGAIVTVQAVRYGGTPAGRNWRVLSGTPLSFASSVDTATVRMPIAEIDGAITLGYAPSDGPEIYLTLSYLRAVDWVMVGAKLTPAVFHVIR